MTNHNPHVSQVFSLSAVDDVGDNAQLVSDTRESIHGANDNQATIADASDVDDNGD
jgi:hypothetical protein